MSAFCAHRSLFLRISDYPERKAEGAPEIRNSCAVGFCFLPLFRKDGFHSAGLVYNRILKIFCRLTIPVSRAAGH